MVGKQTEPEKRLVFLEDAIAKIVDTPSSVAEKVFDGEYGFVQNPAILVDRQFEIIALLQEVPEADTAETVRCKCCRNHEPSDIRNRVWCRTIGRYMKEDGFCSFGERECAEDGKGN